MFLAYLRADVVSVLLILTAFTTSIFPYKPEYWYFTLTNGSGLPLKTSLPFPVNLNFPLPSVRDSAIVS